MSQTLVHQELKKSKTVTPEKIQSVSTFLKNQGLDPTRYWVKQEGVILQKNAKVETDVKATIIPKIAGG